MTNFRRFIFGVICGALLACLVIGGLFLVFGRGGKNNQSVLDSNLISLTDRKGKSNSNEIDKQYDELEEDDLNDNIYN